MIRLIVIALAAVAIACTTTKPDVATPQEGVAIVAGKLVNNTGSHVPRARIYKTSGDYRENVPVTISPSTGQIVSFPATTDINPENMPIVLADGYLLDSRGISSTSVFTTYTYGEYAKLSDTPSLTELKAAIIPGATITEIHELPMTITEARADTARCNEIIRSGLAGCKTIKQGVTIKL